MSDFNHAQLTPWGYIIDTESLSDFLTVAEFNLFTANKFTGDVRIAQTIPSACASIRDFCGWHVSPNLTCGMIYNVRDLRDAFVGGDLLVQLPATFVTSIEKIVLNAVYNSQTGEYEGDVATEYDIGMGSGLLRVYDVGIPDRKSKIFVKYTAGLPNTSVNNIKELTANKVTHAVANPYGINSETAGGVSVSYSGSWASASASSGLTDDSREVLSAYKVKGVY